jgi:hypothetical protein
MRPLGPVEASPTPSEFFGENRRPSFLCDRPSAAIGEKLAFEKICYSSNPSENSICFASQHPSSHLPGTVLTNALF